MIKEIAEEFEKQNRINVLNLLKQIKDLEYEVVPRRSAIQYNSKEENKSITIWFSSYSKKIEKICIDSTVTAWGDNILSVTTGLNTKGVMAISEELYTKYFGGAK